MNHPSPSMQPDKESVNQKMEGGDNSSRNEKATYEEVLEDETLEAEIEGKLKACKLWVDVLSENRNPTKGLAIAYVAPTMPKPKPPEVNQVITPSAMITKEDLKQQNDDNRENWTKGAMLVSWNVRGLNKASKLRDISSRLLKLKPEIVILMKTRVKRSKAKLVRDKLNLKGIDQRKEKVKHKAYVLFRYINSGSLSKIKLEAKHPSSLAVSSSEEAAKARFIKQALINPEGSYRYLSALWSIRKWDKLLNPHSKINTEVLREFYVDAFPSAGSAFSFSTKVRGRTVQFHRDTINEFLGNPLVLQEGQMCRYQESINTVPNVEKISKKIILGGREVERDPYDATIRYCREDLIPKAQVPLLFILHNIRPRSHTCTFIMDTAQLLYLIISEELQTHIAWPGDIPLYQGEAAGYGDENDEEDVEAETENEEETLGGSKTASDDDKEMGGE
ncbi:hypothetical protein KIW84_045572 [Lathyrus oleraceus]|uniref:Putative plant transposon protein domain-containing protein n=1 Tax=Pisum sativum TaxID=3888 RepID=A0A9D4XJB8_PEA|nr:hypothetical protein KIW84_045572 [Pisum sativum]